MNLVIVGRSRIKLARSRSSEQCEGEEEEEEEREEREEREKEGAREEAGVERGGIRILYRDITAAYTRELIQEPITLFCYSARYQRRSRELSRAETLHGIVS